MFYCSSNEESYSSRQMSFRAQLLIFDFYGAKNMLQSKKGHLPDPKQHMKKAQCFSQINVKIQ